MPKLGVASGGFERERFEFYNTPVTMCKELFLQGLSEPLFFVLVDIYFTEAYYNTGDFSFSSWRFP